MPALPAVPKTVRLDLFFTSTGGGRAQIRQFFFYSGTLSNTDAQTWLNNIVAGWGTNMSPNLNQDYTLIRSELTDLTSSSAPQVFSTTAHAGGVTNVNVSAGVAMVIKNTIPRRYRGGHPRVYLPGLSVTDRANELRWDPTRLNVFVTAFTAFIAACTANTNPAAIGTIVHCNVSYYQGFTNHTYPSGRVKAIPTPRVTPLIDSIVGQVGNPSIASQRRRNEQP